MNTPLAAIEGIGAPRGARVPVREVFALLRLAFFMKVDGRDIVGRDSTIALLSVTALAAWILLDPLLHSRELVFSWYGVPDLAGVAAGVLGFAWLLHKLSRPPLEFRRALVLTLGALPLAMLGAVASWKLVDIMLQLLGVVLASWALAYFARALRAITGRRQPIALLAGAAATLLFMLSFDYLQANPRLWVRAEDRLDRFNASGVDWARMSRVQFAQQSRIDADVARLDAQDAAAMDVFFLGFAGYGHQQIFAREIDLASQVVHSRYGSGTRSLRLVNDRTDLDSWPIASEPGLRHALRKLGENMGDEDVLFMVLSSHGDRGEGVRVSSPGTVTTQIDPGVLDDMLDEAGILWRVIVVSACYSGSFVEALSNDQTIVITAAAHDRKSFGCNDSRALTYFGEAFFRDALARSDSLRAAFQAARAALEKKERAGGIVPSLPQASFGRQLEARLNEPARSADPPR
ncbi:MAG TPA: C13 family peptidase [Steroidobacteraceae bacterium]|nr:C13 family peptidase [Steroidobacteraceae bacterium]